MKDQSQQNQRLKAKLKDAKTPEEVMDIAQKVEAMTELSLDELDEIAGGAGGHTHVWHEDTVKFKGLLRSSYCSCGMRTYFFSGQEIANDEYFDIYAHLKSIMPKLENE